MPESIPFQKEEGLHGQTGRARDTTGERSEDAVQLRYVLLLQSMHSFRNACSDSREDIESDGDRLFFSSEDNLDRDSDYRPAPGSPESSYEPPPPRPESVPLPSQLSTIRLSVPGATQRDTSVESDMVPLARRSRNKDNGSPASWALSSEAISQPRVPNASSIPQEIDSGVTKIPEYVPPTVQDEDACSERTRVHEKITVRVLCEAEEHDLPPESCADILTANIAEMEKWHAQLKLNARTSYQCGCSERLAEIIRKANKSMRGAA